MRFQARFATTSVFVLTVLLVWASETPKPLELNIKETVDVANQSAALMVGLFDCDSNSNMFFMPPNGKGLPNAVLRVSADGRRMTRFGLDSVPEFTNSEVMAYTVALDDDVSVVTVKDGRDPYVIRFDKDGKFTSATKLEVAKGTVLRRIAVSTGGDYFIGGSQQDGQSLFKKQVDGIFNASGQMIAAVKLTGSTSPKTAVKVSDIPNLDEAQMAEAQKLQDTVDLSIVRAGQDGNFYFSRFDPNGPVFVVSPSGQVVKEIRLVPPKESGFKLFDIKVSQGRLAVDYEGGPPAGGTSPVKIYVYDIQSGKQVAEYHHENWEIGNALACYSPDTFKFISSDENGKMRLVTAAAR